VKGPYENEIKKLFFFEKSAATAAKVHL